MKQNESNRSIDALLFLKEYQSTGRNKNYTFLGSFCDGKPERGEKNTQLSSMSGRFNDTIIAQWDTHEVLLLRFFLFSLALFLTLISPGLWAHTNGRTYQTFSDLKDSIETPSTEEWPKEVIRTLDKVPLIEAVLDIQELETYALTFAPTKEKVEIKGPLNDLRDGTYVYVIFDNGSVSLLNRMAYPIEGPYPPIGHFVGTHEGLFRLVRPIRILAAGEFTLRNKTVFMFNNKSGTFRGFTENLHFAIRQFKKLGLPFTPTTFILDYAIQSFSLSHGTIARIVRHEIEIQSKPKLLQLLHKAKDILPRASAMEPTELIQSAKEKILGDSNAVKFTHTALYLLSQWRSPVESEADILWRVLKKNSEEDIDNTLHLVAEIHRITRDRQCKNLLKSSK